MDELGFNGEFLVHLARLALAGRPQDVAMYVRRIARKLRVSQPDIAGKLDALLLESPTRQNPLRRATETFVPAPVDADSRLQLVRHENPVVLDVEPILSESIRHSLEQIVSERAHQRALFAAGLSPTRTALFDGPPGVGKTLAARWVARELKLPLVTLDLSAVMSSFLGRTGANIRRVLDYAKSLDCVLLLDEFDAVAKRRDDSTDIGELKRLVTVLLQQIDDWPPGRLLLAATNLPEVLDHAVWRRFDMVVNFNMPTDGQVREAVSRLLGSLGVKAGMQEVVIAALCGASFSEIDRTLRQAHKEAVVLRRPVEGILVTSLHGRFRTLGRSDRKQLAGQLVAAGITQRQAHEWTGVSRDTIRKYGQSIESKPA